MCAEPERPEIEQLNQSVHTWLEESEHSGTHSDDGMSSPSHAGNTPPPFYCSPSLMTSPAMLACTLVWVCSWYQVLYSPVAHIAGPSLTGWASLMPAVQQHNQLYPPMDQPRGSIPHVHLKGVGVARRHVGIFQLRGVRAPGGRGREAFDDTVRGAIAGVSVRDAAPVPGHAAQLHASPQSAARPRHRQAPGPVPVPARDPQVRCGVWCDLVFSSSGSPSSQNNLRRHPHTKE